VVVVGTVGCCGSRSVSSPSHHSAKVVVVSVVVLLVVVESRDAMGLEPMSSPLDAKVVVDIGILQIIISKVKRKKDNPTQRCVSSPFVVEGCYGGGGGHPRHTVGGVLLVVLLTRFQSIGKHLLV
jgi:hypothetical protein